MSGGQLCLLTPDLGILGYPARRMGSSQNLEGSGPCPGDLTMNSRVGLGQDADPVEGRSARAMRPECQSATLEQGTRLWSRTTGCHPVGKLGQQPIQRASCQPQQRGKGHCSSEAVWTRSSTQGQRALGLEATKPLCTAGVSVVKNPQASPPETTRKGQPTEASQRGAGSPLRGLVWSVGCTTASHNSKAVSSLQSV